MNIAIIPIRKGSKGLPQKNIKDFCGKPLYLWTIDRAIQSKNIDKIYITTDDERILNYEYSSTKVELIKRPQHLCTDQASSESAINHVLQSLNNYDNVCFLQATSPLRYIDDIDNAYIRFISTKVDSLMSASESHSFIWRVIDKDKITPINYDIGHRPRRQNMNQYDENGSFYWFNNSYTNNRFFGHIGYYVMKPWQAYQIDNQDDFIMCECLMRKYNLNEY